jgi:hypothetical protein
MVSASGRTRRGKLAPSGNYIGSDSFTYKANDSSLDSEVITVSLTIVAVNDAPVATDDAFTLTYTPDANYNDPDDFTYTASDGSLDSAAAKAPTRIRSTTSASAATRRASGFDRMWSELPSLFC